MEEQKRPAVPTGPNRDIIRTREGVLLPDRNAFEFARKPQRQENVGGGRKKEDSKQKLMKSLLKLKRSSTPSTSSNKFMAIVKYDY
jgi:hypothetical protein